MRNSYRRVFSLIVLLAILLTGVVSVGVAQDQVVIRFFHKWPEPAHVEYYQWVIDEFEAANPNIQIEMEAVADEPYKDKIRVVMASGDVPDIFFSWAGEFSWKFAREGRALPLDDAFFGTDWQNDVINSAAEPYRWEGVLYGLPMRINAKFMVYNKAIFESVGLSAPTTWDEFLATCDALKEADIVPLAFGNEFPWASSHYVGDLNAKLVPGEAIQSDYLLTGEADTLFSHPGYVEALSRFQELNNRGCFNEGANALQHSLARASFIAGRTGMIYVELEEFVTIAEGMGADAFGFFQFPSGTGGEGDQNLLTGAPDGFMVSAETEHPEEALAFLRFLLSPERGAEYVRRLGIPSAVVGAVNDETALPVVVQGVEAINAASGMALWLDTDINIKIVEVYLPGMQALLTGSETPESLMEKVRAAAVSVQAELAQ